MNRSLLGLLLLIAGIFLFNSCTTSEEEDNSQPDMASLITGTYSYTTYYNGNETGSGTATISKDSNTTISIGTDAGISFFASDLKKIDQDMVMEIPRQSIDYYGIPATVEGNQGVKLAASTYDGVYFGAGGVLRASIDLIAEGKTDQLILVLE